MILLSPQQIIANLQQNELFQQWSLQHPEAFLSHLFCPLNDQLLSINNWELGYFDPANEKITVFVPLTTDEQNNFEIKPEDDVFKQEASIIEALNLKNVKISLELLFPLIKEQLKLRFPKEQIGNGFLILQTLNQKTLYNVTFITTSIQFINLKINTETGLLESHQAIELVDKKKNNSTT